MAFNLPANCIGQDVSTRCIYDETTGESLASILGGLKPSKTSSAEKTITTKDIVSTSLMRSQSYVCASKVVKKDFSYIISISQNTVMFSWDFLPVISALPNGYVLATSRVKISGVGSSGGSNQLTNSDKVSAGLSINASNFPIVVDMTVRINSPCGDIDLTSILNIVNPALSGTYRAVLDAKDLNPRNGEISLDDQLSAVEAWISNIQVQVGNLQEENNELRAELLKLKT